MDRTYWRAQDSVRLIDEARHSGHELCIAIGERLEDRIAEDDDRIEEAHERARDAARDADKLDDQVYELGVKNDKLEMMIERRDDEIAHLRDQLNKLKKETAK